MSGQPGQHEIESVGFRQRPGVIAKNKFVNIFLQMLVAHGMPFLWEVIR